MYVNFFQILSLNHLSIWAFCAASFYLTLCVQWYVMNEIDPFPFFLFPAAVFTNLQGMAGFAVQTFFLTLKKQIS